MKKTLPILFSGLWIVFFEFLRNEILFKSIWQEHYSSLGLNFVTTPVNGIFWLFWSLIVACLITILRSKFNRIETILISWTFAFILMWLTIYNLQVLPLRLLIFAVPLSLVEIVVAVLIIDKKNLSFN